MVINGSKLIFNAPIKNMIGTKVYENGVSHGLGEAGYDIRIKEDITFSRDLFLKRCVQRLVLDKDGDILEHHMEPGRFVLASALEEFAMPLNMMAEIKDKSSWARRGLSVYNTVIEPGWRGWLTLELVYNGHRDLHIPAGSGIAQVVFSEVSNPAQYTGRYQNQESRPVPAITSKAKEQLTLDAFERVHVFSKLPDETGGCPYCDKAKAWLVEKGIPHTVEELGPIQRQALYDQYGLVDGKRTVPQAVIYDGEGVSHRIGGYAELVVSSVESLFGHGNDRADSSQYSGQRNAR
jgi:dCTP deaminase